MQVPQPVHLSLSTLGKPSSPILKAPNGQFFTQVPKPKHPYWHSLSPPPANIAARQSSIPIY